MNIKKMAKYNLGIIKTVAMTALIFSITSTDLMTSNITFSAMKENNYIRTSKNFTQDISQKNKSLGIDSKDLIDQQTTISKSPQNSTRAAITSSTAELNKSDFIKLSRNSSEPTGYSPFSRFTKANNQRVVSVQFFNLPLTCNLENSNADNSVVGYQFSVKSSISGIYLIDSTNTIAPNTYDILNASKYKFRNEIGIDSSINDDNSRDVASTLSNKNKVSSSNSNLVISTSPSFWNVSPDMSSNSLSFIEGNNNYLDYYDISNDLAIGLDKPMQINDIRLGIESSYLTDSASRTAIEKIKNVNPMLYKRCTQIGSVIIQTESNFVYRVNNLELKKINTTTNTTNWNPLFNTLGPSTTNPVYNFAQSHPSFNSSNTVIEGGSNTFSWNLSLNVVKTSLQAPSTPSDFLKYDNFLINWFTFSSSNLGTEQIFAYDRARSRSNTDNWYNSDDDTINFHPFQIVADTKAFAPVFSGNRIKFGARAIETITFSKFGNSRYMAPSILNMTEPAANNASKPVEISRTNLGINMLTCAIGDPTIRDNYVVRKPQVFSNNFGDTELLNSFFRITEGSNSVPQPFPSSQDYIFREVLGSGKTLRIILNGNNNTGPDACSIANFEFIGSIYRIQSDTAFGNNGYQLTQYLGIEKIYIQSSNLFNGSSQNIPYFFNLEDLVYLNRLAALNKIVFGNDYGTIQTVSGITYTFDQNGGNNGLITYGSLNEMQWVTKLPWNLQSENIGSQSATVDLNNLFILNINKHRGAVPGSSNLEGLTFLPNDLENSKNIVEFLRKGFSFILPNNQVDLNKDFSVDISDLIGKGSDGLEKITPVSENNTSLSLTDFTSWRITKKSGIRIPDPLVVITPDNKFDVSRSNVTLRIQRGFGDGIETVGVILSNALSDDKDKSKFYWDFGSLSSSQDVFNSRKVQFFFEGVFYYADPLNPDAPVTLSPENAANAIRLAVKDIEYERNASRYAQTPSNAGNLIDATIPSINEKRSITVDGQPITQEIFENFVFWNYDKQINWQYTFTGINGELVTRYYTSIQSFLDDADLIKDSSTDIPNLSFPISLKKTSYQGQTFQNHSTYVTGWRNFWDTKIATNSVITVPSYNNIAINSINFDNVTYSDFVVQSEVFYWKLFFDNPAFTSVGFLSNSSDGLPRNYFSSLRQGTPKNRLISFSQDAKNQANILAKRAVNYVTVSDPKYDGTNIEKLVKSVLNVSTIPTSNQASNNLINNGYLIVDDYTELNSANVSAWFSPKPTNLLRLADKTDVTYYTNTKDINQVREQFRASSRGSQVFELSFANNQAYFAFDISRIKFAVTKTVIIETDTGSLDSSNKPIFIGLPYTITKYFTNLISPQSQLVNSNDFKDLRTTVVPSGFIFSNNANIPYIYTPDYKRSSSITINGYQVQSVLSNGQWDWDYSAAYDETQSNTPEKFYKSISFSDQSNNLYTSSRKILESIYNKDESEADFLGFDINNFNNDSNFAISSLIPNPAFKNITQSNIPRWNPGNILLDRNIYSILEKNSNIYIEQSKSNAVDENGKPILLICGDRPNQLGCIYIDNENSGTKRGYEIFLFNGLITSSYDLGSINYVANYSHDSGSSNFLKSQLGDVWFFSTPDRIPEQYTFESSYSLLKSTDAIPNKIINRVDLPVIRKPISDTDSLTVVDDKFIIRTVPSIVREDGSFAWSSSKDLVNIKYVDREGKYYFLLNNEIIDNAFSLKLTSIDILRSDLNSIAVAIAEIINKKEYEYIVIILSSLMFGGALVGIGSTVASKFKKKSKTVVV